jgi:hypothetical protein
MIFLFSSKVCFLNQILLLDLKVLRMGNRINQEQEDLEPGGVINLFIRRCLLSFNKLMFENFADLFTKFVI